MRILAFAEGKCSLKVRLERCSLWMFLNGLKHLFVHIVLVGFPLFRRFVFFLLAGEDVTVGLLDLFGLGVPEVVIVDVLGDRNGTNIDGGSGGQQVVLVDSTHGATIQLQWVIDENKSR